MGLFLSMSGVIDATSEEVLAALQAFSKKHSKVCELVEGSTNDLGIGVITRDGENTTILYPADFQDWDDASRYISTVLSKPVFSFHIHDGDLWMYVLFNCGQEVDHFNPLPKYWQENLPKEETEKWKGNPELVSHLVPSVSKDAISHYLVEWDLEQEERTKAFSEDEYQIWDCWQVCDFMEKLGLKYPMSNDGSVLGETFYLGKKKTNPQKAEQNKKPWWKIL